jgi:hypothetical protein
LGGVPQHQDPGAAIAGPASPARSLARDLAKVYGFGCLAFVVVVIVVGALMTRAATRCPPEVDARIASPDGVHEAVVFHFECGFGRTGTVNISVQRPGPKLSDPANLFVAMDSSGVDYLLGRGKPPAVEVSWEDATSLVVEYGGGVRVIARHALVDGVRVAYRVRE